MIPQKIQLKNFLSYGSTLQTINFLPYHLICFSGKNGHGKSALLDAITWAVWGQARKISGAAKADQNLLRLGQTQMMVIFDFEFGGKLYRIRREYMETYGKPITVLEFGIIDVQGESFIPLTDKTIRATQEKIEQTLRLDFDSFSNSAFLRQGSSNEFSKKSPKDRKQILATILGLDQYEVIRKLALEKIKDAYAKKNILVALQEKRQQELAAQEMIDAELITLSKKMDLIKQEEINWQQQYTNYTANKIVQDEKQQQYHNFSFQLQQLIDSLATHKKQIRELLQQWRAINKKKQSPHTSAQLEQKKKQIIASITQHQKLLHNNLEQKEALFTIAQQLHSIEQYYKDAQKEKHHLLLLELERLLTEQKNQHKNIALHEEQLRQYTDEDCNITQEIEHYTAQKIDISLQSDNISKMEKHLEKRKASYQHYISLGNWLSTELNNLVRKKKLVHGDDPSCPLCEQNLSASRRRFLKQNFEKQESCLTHRLQRLKRIIPQLKDSLIEHHAQLTSQKEQLHIAATHVAKITELIAMRTKISQTIKELTKNIATLQTNAIAYDNLIAQKQQEIAALQHCTIPYTQEQQSLLQKKLLLEQSLKNNPYQENEYKKAQEELQLIEAQCTDHQALQNEIAEQQKRKNEILGLCKTAKQLTKEAVAVENKRTALGDLSAQNKLMREQESQLELQRTVIKNNKELLLQTKGSIENQQQHLTKLKDEYLHEQAQIITLDTIADDYNAIAAATGKDGIQALLIEDAIPEIEQEANHILSRLTNNQAQIFIESLRDLKKGGTKETLDIKISDQAGIRPYELFSGGEAFRIDFALRIAISKLLARRAGTALQTLIIDEGFGSQDEEGLGHIMDALHKVQDDFSKIIIVSHLPAMKDQFPVQFVIEKSVQGSVVTVFEQG